ncbi:MAG: molybdopterin-synthase adenylyltransferase MoeB [Magnetococcales bacterium]|nr:molybdopterin-synthase adenylyltransferase MoeB [Magnetococcales bacterium]
MPLSDTQIDRYSRQILLREIGGVGQEKLLAAKVFLLGAGGLGSPVALYLAAAGVGTLVIADHDRVDLSNLQRQIIHTRQSVGTPKVHSATRAIAALNSDVTVIPREGRVNAENVREWIAECDLVVDGSDNFATRHLINEACLQEKKTLISGAVLGFEGQVATFRHGIDAKAPCYACLFPTPPAPGTAPTCSTAGVLGALPGLVGTIQATETIKEILGIGQSLAGFMLLINALDGIYHRIQIPKNPDCPLCGGKKG